MSKEQKSTSILLIILGVFELILPSIALFLLTPQLNELNNGLGENIFNPYPAILFFGLIILLSLIQIIRGLFFKKSNLKNSRILIVLGVILAILTIPAVIILIINPIYSLLTTV